MGLLKKPLLLFLLLFASITRLSTHCPAQEFTFDLDELEKKSYHLGGFAEIKPIIFKLDKDAALYRLRFYDRDGGQTRRQYDLTLQLDGSYETGIARLFARTNSHLSYGDGDWSQENTLYEGLLSLNPSPSLTLDLGKKTLKWGTGYAWNPVAFLDRPRDPDDPALALEGYFVAAADLTRSFNGPLLQTVSFTPALVPVYGDINQDFGETGHLNLAARFYFLFMDTDIDFMFLAGGSQPSRYGVAFSRNLATNFAIHAELAWINGFQKVTLDREGRLAESRDDALSYLLGLRYLSAQETTYVLEYYRNGTGYTAKEMRDYFAFIDQGYDAYLSTGNNDLLALAAGLTEDRYGATNPMQNYLYLRISQKEPFDILYVTPSLTWIVNLDDQSFSLAPEMVYSGVSNLELRLKGTVLTGGHYTEYGEKPSDLRLELRARYFF